MDYLRPGLQKIIEKNNVKIIPMYISGLWGSFFSRYNGSACSSIKLLLKEFRRPIHVEIGEAFEFSDLEDAKSRITSLSKE